MSNDQVDEIVSLLQELIDDDGIPRNVKQRCKEMVALLQADESLSIKVNKVLSMLDEVSEDSNIDAYTRSQIWGLASMLEAIDIS
ncbi:MAG: UPF0147 family protein [Candidatus Woesearchaeota archaeon]